MNALHCAPFIRQGKGANSLMMDMMLCIAALLLCAAVLYGFRVIVLWLIGMLTAIACEAAVNRLLRGPYTVGDGSAAVTGSLIALLCLNNSISHLRNDKLYGTDSVVVTRDNIVKVLWITVCITHTDKSDSE